MRASKHYLAAVVASVTLASASIGCDRAPPSRDAAPSAHVALASSAAGEHADDDCRPAQPPRPPAAGPPATALGAEARARLTTLRVSAHVGSVIIRKRGAQWVMAGENGCVVPPGRVERALDNLARLVAVPSKEQPADGRSFELQVSAMIEEERAVYFNVAGRSDAGDLVQLADASTVRIRGLDRTLWSPQPADWCRDHRDDG